jgi:hypothetical protein
MGHMGMIIDGKILICRMKKSLIVNAIVALLQEWSKVQSNYKNN